MKRFQIGVLVLVVAAATMASPAFAGLRVPQIGFTSTGLNTLFNSLGETTINEMADQMESPVWLKSPAGVAALTIQFDLSGNANGVSLGIEKLETTPFPGTVPAGDCEVFPGTAQSDWFATATFLPGDDLNVRVYDASATQVASNTYHGVNKNYFGYYIKRGGNTFFSHDGLNPDGKAHAVAYQGTGGNVGSWWLCWEDETYAAEADADFDDAVLFLQQMNPTPVSRATWSKVKALFR